MLRDWAGVDSDSEDAGRIEDPAGRLLAGRLADLREAGRDFGVAERGRDEVDLGLADDALGVAELRELPAERDVDAAVPGMPVSAWSIPAGREVRADVPRPDVLRADVLRADVLRADVPRADVPRAEVRDDGRVDVPRDEVALDDVPRADGRVDEVLRVAGLRALVVRDVVDARRTGVAGATLADDIVLAAAVSAFAAVIIALVAVFIDFMADDIVCADAVALVAAAVILVAADVTLVAAEETPLAAVAGVAELRLPRLAVLRRPAPEREAVERDAVDRDAVLRVDREVVPREDERAAVPLADLAAVLRAVLGVALDDLELELDGRLAVPLDALRLADLLRAVLAEPRRVAARVVD